MNGHCLFVWSFSFAPSINPAAPLLDDCVWCGFISVYWYIYINNNFHEISIVAHIAYIPSAICAVFDTVQSVQCEEFKILFLLCIFYLSVSSLIQYSIHCFWIIYYFEKKNIHMYIYWKAMRKFRAMWFFSLAKPTHPLLMYCCTILTLVVQCADFSSGCGSLLWRRKEQKNTDVGRSQPVHFNGTFINDPNKSRCLNIRKIEHSQYLMLGLNALRYSGKYPLWI